MDGTSILLIPPSFTLIFRHKLDKVCGVVLLTFFAWTHWVAIPSTVSPTLLTSAKTRIIINTSYIKIGKNLYRKRGSCQEALQQRVEVLQRSISGIETSVQLDQDRWRICRSMAGRWLACRRRLISSVIAEWNSCKNY